MKHAFLKKAWIVGIIFLFIGASVVSGLNTNSFNCSQPVNRGWLYVGGSGPGNYTTIQSAINNASNSDTVFVYDDSSPYYEHIIINKSINLIGENKDTTIIDGSGDGNIITVAFDWINISGFKIQNSHYGIFLNRSGNYNTLSNNIIKNNLYGIHLIDTPNNNSISYNTITNNSGNGIFIQFMSNNNNITNNLFTNNGAVGIYIYNSNNNKISGNIISNNNIYGIELRSSSCYNIILGNTITSNGGKGILLHSSFYNNILKNTITYSGTDGIGFEASSLNCISYNTIALNNLDGIFSKISDSNTINANLITTNKNCGVYIDDSRLNNILNNTISDNIKGIHVMSDSYQNLIYNNKINNNTVNSYDDHDNKWNITKTPGTNIIGGSYLGGNYWSDYNGTDADGDGFGDTPYNISGPGGNKDFHPLIDITPPEITNVSANPPTQNLNGYINISCNVLDKVAVDEVWVNITFPDNTTHNYSMNQSYYFNQTYSQIGTYQFFIWANDTNNNINISAGHTFQIESPQEPFIAIFIGLITDLNNTGADTISFKAKFVFFAKLDPIEIGRVIPDEEICVSKDYRGYLGPKFILGKFTVEATEFP